VPATIAFRAKLLPSLCVFAAVGGFARNSNSGQRDSFLANTAGLGSEKHMSTTKLGIGFIGSGFNTRFHIRSWVGVRDADVGGVWSPNSKHAEEAAALARSLRVGDAKAFNSIEEMIADPSIDCIWLCGPNQMRIENMEAIVHAVTTGKGQLVGIACEKP